MLLVWETNKPPEIKGPHKYDVKQGAVKILLDGQQRVTTLYILTRGCPLLTIRPARFWLIPLECGSISFHLGPITGAEREDWQIRDGSV